MDGNLPPDPVAGPVPPDRAAADDEVSALVAGHGRVSLLTPDGELIEPAPGDALRLLRTLPPPLVVHAPATARRLGVPSLPALDLLELFCFVMPARLAAPTPRGLAIALGLPEERIGDAGAALLPDLAARLLDRAASLTRTAAGAEMRASLPRMAAAGWSWAPALGWALRDADPGNSNEALRIWRRLPKWEEAPPRPPPGSLPVSAAEARQRLGRILGPDAEQRVGQADYADAAAAAFAPRAVRGDPRLVLAEAGTGTGKTLGYVAPASLWAERNGGAVWISTYTRHLQRQIENELSRLHPDAAARRRRVVIRKGRENYLCLLNLEEAVNSGHPSAIVPLSLLVRWTGATTDGDVLGGDLPGWFAELWGHAYVSGLADRRGECIHGACTHYTRCFIEHGIRRARDADLVVANHALVMAQAAYQNRFGEASDEDGVPTRYVFDEGHHLFDAADGAFSAELSGGEAAELRRWLVGAEGGRSRARGLRRRLDELVVGQPALETPLDAALLAARALPAPGWATRLAEVEAPPAWPMALRGPDGTGPLPGLGDGHPPGGASGERARSSAPDLGSGGRDPARPSATAGAADVAGEGARAPSSPDGGEAAAVPALPSPATGFEGPAPGNPTESLLRLLRRQVLARTSGRDADPTGNLECDLQPVPPELADAAAGLARALNRVAEPLRTLVSRLEERLDAEADALDATERARIEAMCRVIRRRALSRLESWVAMLDALPEPPEPGVRPTYVTFGRLLRGRGRDRQAGPAVADRDVGLHRHWLDPTVPFAATLATPAHGLLITSATLRDRSDDPKADPDAAWHAAEARVGASHLPSPALRAALASPFDYGRQTRCFVVTDVAPEGAGGIDALAAAFRTLFIAAGGGGLGLFTAISRLRAVHQRLAVPLEEAGIPLFSQHVDAMDNATLVDVFRTERDSCLLGTDAMRDGVDVPGAALRLVVFERVPWPRPDILHRERRIHLSDGAPGAYDDRVARLRLRQAFGRLIRSANDRGVFVLLDRRMPSRLLSAFPPGADPRRVGLAEAAAECRRFLAEPREGGD
ncbi:helicase C-terminal domain-containing protein [Rhizosaccharibacter radicis]|uniref:ATP-dependent DNA helicase n=1 Tax=Rhizosaccharibacter radicis TaxID=2782605 RepID=A0ABT1VVT7_9PROT|nr:ATP-dependent DNA helicase [Acetobacteraceae bacterium KSS12]